MTAPRAQWLELTREGESVTCGAPAAEVLTWTCQAGHDRAVTLCAAHAQQLRHQGERGRLRCDTCCHDAGPAWLCPCRMSVTASHPPGQHDTCAAVMTARTHAGVTGQPPAMRQH